MLSWLGPVVADGGRPLARQVADRVAVQPPLFLEEGYLSGLSHLTELQRDGPDPKVLVH